MLESKWPCASSNARVLWRRLRNLIFGVLRFKLALAQRRRREYPLTLPLSQLILADAEVTRVCCYYEGEGRDTDSVGQASIDSGGIIDDAELSPRRDDYHSASSDRGYSSLSQDDLMKEDPAGGKTSVSHKGTPGSLLLTTAGVVIPLPLSCSL